MDIPSKGNIFLQNYVFLLFKTRLFKHYVIAKCTTFTVLSQNKRFSFQFEITITEYAADCKRGGASLKKVTCFYGELHPTYTFKQFRLYMVTL